MQTMVTGIGIDLVDVRRFQDIKEKDNFIRQFLTESEYSDAVQETRRDFFCARIFAIKEAIFKALGCGLHYGAYWHDIEIHQDLM